VAVTDRLVLRYPRRGDIEAVDAILDDVVVAAQGWTPESRAEYVAAMGRPQHRHSYLVVCARRRGTVLGLLSLGMSNGSYALGVNLGPEGRGRGLGAEAVAAAVPYLARLGVSGLVIETAESNVAMRRSAERAGFAVKERYEQTLPDGTCVPALRYVRAFRLAGRPSPPPPR
jgi:RimJ/RimL family protein N-acetyltransferase